MGVIRLPKKIEDIQERKPMPEDWYRCRLIEDAQSEENSKQTGFNIVLKLEVVSDNPEFNGRWLRTWVPLPVEGDSSIFFDGQSREDQKMEKIVAFVEAFGDSASIEDDEVEFRAGGEALFMVTVGEDFKDTSKLTNSIDFNSPPRSVE